MLEYPEIVTIAAQIRESVGGRPIAVVSIAEPHPRFMFLNQNLGDYEDRLVGRRIVDAIGRGKWIHAMLDSGDILLLGEMFGQVRYVEPDEMSPSKVHAAVVFEDGGRLVVTIQAWGGFQVLTPEELAAHPDAGTSGVLPLEDAFTPERFTEILDGSGNWSRKPIKAFLVHEGNVAGIGNGMLQDILFRAKLSPKRKIPDLDASERRRLRTAIVETMSEAVRLGGRDTERDLFGEPGGYVPLLDRRTNGTPCPECGTPIEKVQYLGGSCYVCPSCQA